MIDSICIFRPSNIGKVMNALPMLRAIQNRHPNASITWIIEQEEYELVREIPKVKWEIVELKHKVRTKSKLRKLPVFDVVLDLESTYSSSRFTKSLKTDTVIALDAERSSRFQKFFCDQQLDRHKDPHDVETALDFAKALGASSKGVHWGLEVSAMHEETSHIDLPTNYMAMYPSSEDPNSSWTPIGYVEIINKMLYKHNVATVLLGNNTQAERDFGDEIMRLSPQAYNLIGETSFRQSASIISDARLLLAPDCVNAYIAAAVSTKVVGVFANTNPKKSNVYLNDTWTVDKYSLAVKTFLKTRPSRLKFGTKVDHEDAMLLIDSDEVLEIVESILNASDY